MKRKLNESLATSVQIDLTSLFADYPNLRSQVYVIGSYLENAIDASVTKEGKTLIVNGADAESVIAALEDKFNVNDADIYVESDDLESDYTDDIEDVDVTDSFDEEGDWAAETFEYPDYEDVDVEDDEPLNDEEAFDEMLEDEEFECYESVSQKKQGCCPPKKVNLSEAVKMHKNGHTLTEIVNDAKASVLTESTIQNAMLKAKRATKAKKLAELKEALGETKYNLVVKALKEGRTYLYEKKTINGKNITEYTSKELYDILKTVSEQKNSLVRAQGTLNESANTSLNEKIETKTRLIDLLDEELTYRLTFKKLNEDEEKKEDEVNPLEPLPVSPTETSEDEEKKEDSKEETEDSKEEAAEETSEEETEEDNAAEDDEVVELSRVIITLASKDAAEDLKKDLVDAGIPEDALEIEDGSEESEDDEDTDETEESTEETEEGAGESNESTHYNTFKKLLEDEETTEDEAAEEPAEGEDETEEESEEGDGSVKLILTDTDHIDKLQDVLVNQYGFTEEEFTEYIGGEVVSEDDSEEATDDETEESSEEETEESSEKKDDKESAGDAAVDDMSDEELKNLFGGN